MFDHSKATQVVVYLHSDKDSMCDLFDGRASGAALRKLAYALSELKVHLLVNLETGDYAIERVEEE